MNCISKIFTQILYTRINKFCENYKVLPEWQNGFRQKRSCLYNIFILNSITQIHLNKERGKVYALFVDFSKAFDSVSHNLLWHKLSKKGISSKIINILKDLYSKANMVVKNDYGISFPVKITKGVLQGEILSPILFAIFIADLENFFMEKGIPGVSVNHLKEVLLLAYADDIVFLSTSYIQMKKILQGLYEYCKLNGLKVNIDKTKI